MPLSDSTSAVPPRPVPVMPSEPKRLITPVPPFAIPAEVLSELCDDDDDAGSALVVEVANASGLPAAHGWADAALGTRFTFRRIEPWAEPDEDFDVAMVEPVRTCDEAKALWRALRDGGARGNSWPVYDQMSGLRKHLGKDPSLFGLSARHGAASEQKGLFVAKRSLSVWQGRERPVQMSYTFGADFAYVVRRARHDMLARALATAVGEQMRIDVDHIARLLAGFPEGRVAFEANLSGEAHSKGGMAVLNGLADALDEALLSSMGRGIRCTRDYSY